VPPGDPVQFDAPLFGLSGECPAVTFSADRFQVIADGDTKFTHGRCRDLSNGDHVTVDGIAHGATVVATQIDMKPSRRDH
jgi:uncharacterized protein DUF5666